MKTYQSLCQKIHMVFIVCPSLPVSWPIFIVAAYPNFPLQLFRVTSCLFFTNMVVVHLSLVVFKDCGFRSSFKDSHIDAFFSSIKTLPTDAKQQFGSNSRPTSRHCALLWFRVSQDVHANLFINTLDILNLNRIRGITTEQSSNMTQSLL